MTKQSGRAEAVRFLSSLRGQYIMGQALYTAIETLKAVPEPYTEHSNIEDMEYLQDEVFPMFKELKGAENEARKQT